MNVRQINPTMTTNKKACINSAKRGAVTTASVFALTNAAMSIMSPKNTQASILNAGGVGKYLKNIALYTGASAALGAVLYAGIEALNIRASQKAANNKAD